MFADPGATDSSWLQSAIPPQANAGLPNIQMDETSVPGHAHVAVSKSLRSLFRSGAVGAHVSELATPCPSSLSLDLVMRGADKVVVLPATRGARWAMGRAAAAVAVWSTGLGGVSACTKAESRPATPVQSVRKKASAPAPKLPAVSVTLEGALYGRGGSAQKIGLTIHLDPARVRGAIRYAGKPQLALLSPRIETLFARGTAPVVRARYRLHYAVNRCEHAKPQRGAMTRWDQCFYRKGQKRPMARQRSVLYLNRELTPVIDRFWRAGIQGLDDLSVFRIEGAVTH